MAGDTGRRVCQFIPGQIRFESSNADGSGSAFQQHSHKGEPCYEGDEGLRCAGIAGSRFKDSAWVGTVSLLRVGQGANLVSGNAWNEAEKHKDARAIDGLLATAFVYTDSGGLFMNKEQYLASIEEAGYHPDQIVNESMEVRAYLHAAVVTGTYREKGTERGKTYSRHGRFTDLWVQEEDGWFCAASHETLIAR